MSTPTETSIQRDIIAALRKLGVWVVRAGRQKRRGPTTAESLEDGFPDLIVMLDGGRVGFGEVKRPGEDLRPSQTDWHARAARNGQRVAVWESVEQAVRSVNGWRSKGT